MVQRRPRAPNGDPLRWLLAHYRDDPSGPCVLWPYSLAPNGYGQNIRIGGAKIGPHVYALTLRDGPAPPGMEARHGPCHQPACIIHVTWGTRAENAADKIRDGTVGRGEKNGQAKLTEADVLEIRRLRSEGVILDVLAAQFGVDQALISRIARRKVWAWLP